MSTWQESVYARTELAAESDKISLSPWMSFTQPDTCHCCHRVAGPCKLNRSSSTVTEQLLPVWPNKRVGQGESAMRGDVTSWRRPGELSLGAQTDGDSESCLGKKQSAESRKQRGQLVGLPELKSQCQEAKKS